MRTLNKDRVIYSFCSDHPFAYKVQNGETFRVETEDCYGGQLKTEADLRKDLDESRLDAAVGPIEVTDALPGDVLCVEVLDIQLAGQGVMTTAPGLGILGNLMDVMTTKVIPVRDSIAFFTEDIKLPVSPMIGVMGVLPSEGEFKCTVPGDFGGNMDTKEVTVGTKVFLPVFVTGAGLAVGDLHACMGDGELSGTGLEIAGEILLKVSVIKGWTLERPLLETKDAVYATATGNTMEEAAYQASRDMTDLLMNRLELTFADAYRLMSAVCDIRISQVVNGVYTLKVRAPKYLFQKEIT